MDALEVSMESLRKKVDSARKRKQLIEEKEVARQRARVVRGRSSSSVVTDAQLSLFGLACEGRFKSSRIKPQSEFPTLLTRLPIFVPGHQAGQRALLDADNALPFSCSWGTGRRHGPLLTIYDEDTLIAMGKLRQHRLRGHPGRFPVPQASLCAEGGLDSRVHIAQFMLSDIHRICGCCSGGENNRKRLNSIKKLAGTSIELNSRLDERYVGTGTTIKLIDVLWKEYEKNAIVCVQFPPMVATWFEEEYTYINWELRRKLSDTGKAHHRFLSSQRKHYKITTKLLKVAIGYSRPYKKYMMSLRADLEQLTEEGWIERAVISGNNRSVPHTLEIWRS